MLTYQNYRDKTITLVKSMWTDPNFYQFVEHTYLAFNNFEQQEQMLVPQSGWS